MFTLDPANAPSSNETADPLATTLDQLSARVRALWAASPDGNPADREALVMDLFYAEIAVERVILRASLDAADPEVATEVDRLVVVFDDLERRWFAALE